MITIMDFWAEWCGPCKAYNPVLEKLERDNDNIKVIKVNVEQEPQKAEMYGVQGLPTLLVMHGEELIGSVTGSNIGKLMSLVNEGLAF